MENINKDDLIAQMKRLRNAKIITDFEAQHIIRCVRSMSDQQLREFRENAIKECS